MELEAVIVAAHGKLAEVGYVNGSTLGVEAHANRALRGNNGGDLVTAADIFRSVEGIGHTEHVASMHVDARLVARIQTNLSR